MSWPWSQLGLTGPSELPEIRRAYAEKLKTTHPEDDPEGFQRLHSAYQLASRMARQQKRRTESMPVPQTEHPARPKPPRPPEEEFDCDELLQDGEKHPQPRRREDGEREFDYDELLRDGGEQPRPRHEEDQEPDFDFERLFAEGEAERARARRQRGEERRGRQETVRLPREQEYWQGTEAILHTIEMMYNARAGAEDWQKFFQSPLFQQNRGSLDLIFGLEDFVSTRSLSQEVRLALFLGCGFDKGVSRPELRPLYQMLLPAWKAARREKDHERNLAILGVVLGVAFPFVFVPLLELGLIPALVVSLGVVWIIWVIRKVVKTGNLEKQARGQKVSKKQERRSIVKGAACVLGLVLLLSWIQTRPELNWRNLLPARDPREQVCRYIEEDLGVAVGSVYNRNEQYATEENGNLFYVEPDTSKVFLAGPDGERDVKNGRAGYTTNLPEMLLLWRLRDFAREYNLTPVDGMDQGLERGETTGTFLITLPPLGGEEIITGLGELLEELSREEWYKALPPRCELVLCGQKMVEGRLVLIRVHPATEVYSVSQIQGLYEDGFAHAWCAQVIKELELDRDFIREGGEHYTLTNGGMASMRGSECCRLFGLDADGAAAIEYYVDVENRNIYCVPGNFWETGNTEDQLSFYRLLHWGDDLGLFSLFYPWLRVN